MNFIKSYSKFVVKYPFVILLIALIITIYSFAILNQLSSKSLSVDEILPSDLEVTQGLYKLNDNLGGGESSAFMVVIELEPEIGSYINDIRNPEILKYSELLGNQILTIEDITKYDGIDTKFKNFNNDQSLNSLMKIKDIYNNHRNSFSRIINEKYSLTVLRVYANQGFDIGYLEKEVQKIIDNTPKPRGIKVLLAGEEIAKKISEEMTQPDSKKTSMISLFSIIIILLIIFRSIIYSILPLLTIIFGVIWMLGFMVISKIAMSTFTAGAISMIIGIGIDFGIQTIMRYRQELAEANPVVALENTLNNVLKPMLITTMAAFIGFWTMTMGIFLPLGELGKIMGIGVVYCFLSAATVVPALAIIYEKHKNQLNLKYLLGISSVKINKKNKK